MHVVRIFLLLSSVNLRTFCDADDEEFGNIAWCPIENHFLKSRFCGGCLKIWLIASNLLGHFFVEGDCVQGKETLP